MRFTRLRLCGFKSFVDATDLPIGEGLTGIVGPNGCGKSNLVEALKWVMGENSPKRMRGGGMDDVIFAGTATRPSRNLAEVTLALDNAERTASAEFNDAEEIEVSRRIERASGSDYRINSRLVRQKDVQLLFADQSTGAQSTSVIGQGQIDALIRAKPQDRRQILEEASGTSGLAARRHEAELKLKGAEQNLIRVDDVLQTLDAQLRNLKQQVRQASRYKNLAEHIRRTEAGLLRLKWAAAQTDEAQACVALEDAQRNANDLLALVARGTTERTNAAADLPSLRQTEAMAAVVVQKLVLACERVRAEASRVAEAVQTARTQEAQAQTDLAREQAQHGDSLNAAKRLEAEKAELDERLEKSAALLPKTDEELAVAQSDVSRLDKAHNALVDSLAQARAQTQALVRELESAAARRTFLSQRRIELETKRAGLVAEITARGDLSLAGTMVDACEAELERRKQQAEQAQQARRDAEEAQSAARRAAEEGKNALVKKRAEKEAIEKVLAHGHSDAEQVIDLIAVPAGLEKALAVALGEALSASLDPQTAMYWRELEALACESALPASAKALSSCVKAPPALARALAHIGLVDDRTAGESAASVLLPGQSLVSKDGWAWRWDGFTLSPQAQTASALRLEQRNRLSVLEEDIARAEESYGAACAALEETSSLVTQCQALDRQTREALNAAFAALADARGILAKQERDALETSARLSSLDDSLRSLAQEMDAIQHQAFNAEQARLALPELATLEAEIGAQRLALAQAREVLAEKKGARDSLARETLAATRRRDDVVRETAAWNLRAENATKQTEILKARIETHAVELARLSALPVQFETQSAALMTEMAEAERARSAAADALVQAENMLADIEKKLKADEAALGDAREDRVRAEAARDSARALLEALRERAREKLDCAPESLADIAVFKEGEEGATDMLGLEALLARYVRERDGMGPVNLRAEMETKAAEEEKANLTREKDDLTAAIGKLRHGIGQLNREARERLNEAFHHVNERFQKLFTSLFGGGKASLELIDADDPMNAGLEIFAAPPGKKQQVLSLLSGGERTLTALALVFAVFQTKPSPICVLDEAEAALDESNIGRFCELVKTIGKETGTRFLIVTHQRLTMANMDRLFGVTMSERGVSQLVSVDLASAVALREKDTPEARAQSSLSAVRAA